MHEVIYSVSNILTLAISILLKNLVRGNMVWVLNASFECRRLVDNTFYAVSVL